MNGRSTHTHEFVTSTGGNEDLLAKVAFDQPANGKRSVGRPARIANIKSGHELMKNLAMLRMRQDRLTAEFFDGDPASGRLDRAARRKRTYLARTRAALLAIHVLVDARRADVFVIN